MISGLKGLLYLGNKISNMHIVVIWVGNAFEEES